MGTCSPRVVVGSPTTDAGDGGPAVKAQLFNPLGLAKDSAGNLYIADSGNNKIRLVRTDGTIQTFAGTGIAGGTGDGGPATLAELNNPVAVTVGPDGGIYVVEKAGNRVRKITGGTMHTVAGTGQGGFGGDGGPASQARLKNPSAAAFDGNGNLYIADTENYRVRRVAKDGTISTYAGIGDSPAGGPADGVPAVNGYLVTPVDVAAASDGTVYVAANGKVKSITPDGELHTVAGGGQPAAEGVPAAQASLDIGNIGVDAQGALVIVGGGPLDIVWKVMPDGTLHQLVSTYRGAGLVVGGDGTITRSVYDSRVMSYAGNPPPFDASPHQTLAGSVVGGDFGDGSAGTLGAMQNPGGLAADAAGNVYITDTDAGKIRKLDTKGIITTIAGTGHPSATPDGVPALESALYGPAAITVSRSGEVYYAEPDTDLFKKIGTDQLVTTIAGNGASPSPYPWSGSDFREGKPAKSVAVRADSFALAGDGTLYIADLASQVIWRVTADGIIHKAVAPHVNGRFLPMATDPAGSVYYLDYGTELMRFGSNGTPEAVRDIGHYFRTPHAFTLDGAGNIYVTDGANIAKYALDGTVSVLTNTRDSGPSPALLAVALDPGGNLFAIDERARVIEVPSGTTCQGSIVPRIVQDGGLNAASYERSWVAPGEMVSIFGIAVGPAKLTSTVVDAAGRFATKVGETQVFFDGVPAPIVYASSGVTAAIAPFGASGHMSINLQVSVNGFLSNIVSMQVGDAQPGIFTQAASGSGQGSVLNQDYSVNSASHPARKGSVVMVYATGLGLVDPPVEDGAIASSALSRHVQDVTAWIAGNQADVLYAGTAPGIVSGASQINIRIPPETPSGDVSLSIKVGPDAGKGQSQENVTIAVQ
ncbi:MAG: hypothetical protein U0Q18_30605 [Bryobacteraceae bacterium]